VRHILKEPIQQKVLLLVIIFFAAFIGIVVADTVFVNLVQSYEAALENQLAHRSLGKVLLRKLLAVEKDFFELALTDDRRDIAVLENEIATSIQDIQSVLDVLSDGGTFEDVLPANFDDVDEIREPISFSRDKDKGYVVEVIDLTPKILDIEQTATQLVQAVNVKFDAASASEQLAAEEDIALLLKQADTFLLRSREGANKIFYDTHLDIEHLERNQAESTRLFNVMRYAIVVVIGVIEIVILVLTLSQIRGIVKEREAQAGNLQEANRKLQSIRASLEQHNAYLQTRVKKYVGYMAGVAKGNLSARLTFNDKDKDDPLTILGLQLNDTAASLQVMILQIREAAHDLSSAAAEILAVTTQQSAGANEQSVSIAQTTTTVDEVKIIAEQAVSRAQEVANASQRSVEISHDGRQAVQNTINGMGRIKERVESIAENILALSEQTQQIGDIIASVNDLATQSNMLALNAAVEAARAGEHGKGFAVVASEVRALAEQSKQATAQITTILEDIQKATNTTVMATEEGTKGVDEGVLLAAQAQDAIAQLAGVIDESTQAATQMVAGGRQQATGVEQIALAMNNINQATAQSLASTRQAEKTAQDLSELARSLSEIVEQYQV
jgi:methyl-accepting chemotaxis protein